LNELHFGFGVTDQARLGRQITQSRREKKTGSPERVTGRQLIARLARFASQSFRPQAFAIVIKGLLRGFVVAHCLFGVGAPFRIPGGSLFGCEHSRRAS